MLVDDQVSFCLQPMFMLVLLSVLFSHYVRPFYTIERDARVSERLTVEASCGRSPPAETYHRQRT